MSEKDRLKKIREKPDTRFYEKSGRGTDSYDTMCEKFSIDVPEYFNFGFDVLMHGQKRIATNWR